MNLELADVAVQSLVPAPLQSVASADAFMQQLPQYDAEMAQQVSEADASGECLRFVGKPAALACFVTVFPYPFGSETAAHPVGICFICVASA